MTDVNSITGDKLMSKQNNKNYEDGYDRIFKDKVDLHTTKEVEKCSKPPQRKAQQWVLGSEGYFQGSVQEEEGQEACGCKGD
jgi:hypothetical protein